MKLFKIINIILLMSILVFAESYEVPVGSQDNTIQLSIKNETESTVKEIDIEPKNVPEFIDIRQVNMTDSIASQATGSVKYGFSIQNEAQVDSSVTLRFDITGDNTAQKVKEIDLKTAAPKKFKLDQNYPNPFNPTTTISYQLPQESKVRIDIFNINGQKVETLVQDSKEAGIHQKKWNASRYSSGIYFYRVRIENSQETKTETRKMTILK